MSKKFILLIIAIIAVFTIAILTTQTEFSYNGLSHQEPETPDNPQSSLVDTSTWVIYTAPEYGFELKHPEDWTVVNYSNNPIFPAYNVHKKNENPQNPPLTHFSEATHLSIYPEGIPTEGVFGQTATSTISIPFEYERAQDFLLQDGKRWATYIVPGNSAPPSWGEPGFIWAALNINNQRLSCLRDGKEISQEMCDPILSEDRLVRSGSINEMDRKILDTIITTITFMNN